MEKELTPLMRQYFSIKSKHPDALLLFRVGDFYETFGNDAIKASKILDIILTARNNGKSKIELAGFPYHALNNYLPKLVRAGNRVAICDQLELPSKEKKIVKRGVTELVTPGVIHNETILEKSKNNFLAAISFKNKDFGVAFLDISTGEFHTTQGKLNSILNLISKFKPSEIIYNKDLKSVFFKLFGHLQTTFFGIESWVFEKNQANNTIKEFFKVNSLKGFGLETYALSVLSCSSILHYLSQTNNKNTKHINNISIIDESDYVWLDHFTINNLELITPLHHKGTALINILDHTVTAPGSRLLKRWVVMPSKQLEVINNRLQVIEWFHSNETVLSELRKLLETMGDLERLTSKVALERINPKEMLVLKDSLRNINPIKKLLEKKPIPPVKKLYESLNNCEQSIKAIESVLKEDAPLLIQKGNVIKPKVSKEIDQLRDIKYKSKQALDAILKKAIENTKINSLKIGFNNVFGYYLEVRNTFKNQVPEEWIRKQTLTSAERYITKELKDLEIKILTADDQLLELEKLAYQELIKNVGKDIQSFQKNAVITAQLDCLAGFAYIATKNKYCKPEISHSRVIDIKEGRHPVIEKKRPLDQPFIANNLYLDKETQQIMMITGPNMSGKSAILRQTALIILMSQIGSFVPATQCKTGIIDKIFTRVGASDNISEGESTFMVEMNETSMILNNLSDNSLILLDEIGRGTSTYDGISIAWSIAEFIHNHPKYKAKTLFATHYHELNKMTNHFPRIKNFSISVKEHQEKIIFLRKLIPSGSNHSFGIHVAQMAGIPKEIIKSANKMLKQLENQSNKNFKKEKDDNYQLNFYNLDNPALENVNTLLTQTDINTLTPIEALMKLNQIKDMLTLSEKA